LSKDSADRPASAKAVAESLQRLGEMFGAKTEVTSPARPIAQALAQNHWATIFDDEAPAPKKAPAPAASKEPSKSRPRWPLVVATCLGVALVVALGAVIFFQTPKGKVRIEINDPDLIAELSNGTAVIKGPDTQEISIEPGEHALKVKRGDLEFETSNFVIKKG